MRRWPYTFAVVLSLITGATAIVATLALDVTLKDPEGFLGPAYVRLPVMGLGFFALGIVPQALKRFGIKGFGSGMRTIVREEWTWRRAGYIATGLLCFYVSYVGYRNLKSLLPLIREDVIYDTDFLRIDHWLAFGNNPAELLHAVLGTTVMAQVLAFVYVSYLPLIPVTLAAFLVLNRDVSIGAWYATALCLNWVLGTVSYYIFPTLGPAFAQPSMFLDLPDTGVTALQQSLFKNGVIFKSDPTGETIYGIAGFASLHVSVTLTAALFFHHIGLKPALRYIAWAYFVLTVVATLYFGWHYILDDFAGAFIAWASVTIGALVTGNFRQRRPFFRRRKDPAPDPQPTPAA